VDALVAGFATVLGLVLGNGFVADGFVSKDGMDFGFVVTTLVDLKPKLFLPNLPSGSSYLFGVSSCSKPWPLSPK
jgi:hypothetical protein